MGGNVSAKKEQTDGIKRKRKRLALELEGHSDVEAMQEERMKAMDGANPRVVLRNYIAQNAIEAAENGDFSEVQRVLKVLEKPFCDQPGLELPAWMGEDEATARAERDEGDEPEASTSRNAVPYDSKPPAWAQEICVT